MEFNFRKDLENLDDRSKMANMMLKLIYQKHNGDLDKCLPDVDKFARLIFNTFGNINDLVESEIPLIRYHDLIRCGAIANGYSEDEYHEAMEATDRACILYYGDKSDIAVTNLFYKAINDEKKESNVISADKEQEDEILWKDKNIGKPYSLRKFGDEYCIVKISDQDPEKGVQKLADELGVEISFTGSFKDHENDKSKEDPQNRREEFTKVVRPVMKWLCENHHPHTSIIIDGTNAQLLEGLASTGQIMDYVKD